MLFSKWTFFQGGVLLGMAALVFIAEFFSAQIRAAMTSGPMMSLLIVLTFIVIGCSLISLFLIFHSKKSGRFLAHPLWDKMGILIVVAFVLSAVFFIGASLFTSLNDVIASNRWVLYAAAYYFLILANLFVLSVVHKMNKQASKEKKVELSFLWTALGLFVLLFLFPSL